MWVVFNSIFRFRIPGHVPYIIYLLSGILAVTYFQQGVAITGASMASAANVLTKVYVPPIVFAVSAATAGAVNFLLGLVPLFAFQLALGIGVAWTAIFVPLPLLFLLAMISGIGLVIAVLAAQFTDVRELTNVLLFLISYLTPSFYPITAIPASYRQIFKLNPMYSYLDVFRHLEYGASMPPWQSCVMVVASGVFFLLFGLAFFVRRWPRLAALL